MKTIETIAEISSEGKLMLDVPGLSPGLHRIKLSIDEEIAVDEIPGKEEAPRTYKGRRVYTEEDRKHMDPPLPPEPEWEAEWKKRENA